MTNEKLLTLPAQGEESEDKTVQQLLAGAKKKLGFIPNMYAYMANAPHMLENYLFGYDKFRSQSGFTPAEQEVVLLTISRVNRCHYCVAAHSFMADNVSGVSHDVTDAIRSDAEIRDDKLRALSLFTRTMVENRGWADAGQIGDFLAAGFTEKNVLDILLAISVKTISNYANHLFATPLDGVFTPREWRG